MSPFSSSPRERTYYTPDPEPTAVPASLAPPSYGSVLAGSGTQGNQLPSAQQQNNINTEAKIKGNKNLQTYPPAQVSSLFRNLDCWAESAQCLVFAVRRYNMMMSRVLLDAHSIGFALPRLRKQVDSLTSTISRVEFWTSDHIHLIQEALQRGETGLRGNGEGEWTWQFPFQSVRDRDRERERMTGGGSGGGATGATGAYIDDRIPDNFSSTQSSSSSSISSQSHQPSIHRNL